MMKKYVSIIQVTDCHLFADKSKTLLGRNTFNSLHAILALIEKNHPNPDLILLTGDLSQDGTEESYQQLLHSFKMFQSPIYWIPGNHDHVPTMGKQLQTSHFDNKKCIELQAWGILLLNSVKDHETAGYITQNDLEKLSLHLKKLSSKHVLLCLHHQPIPIGSEWLDNLGLLNPKAFFHTIKNHNHVKGILYGHVHQEFIKIHNGVTFMASPSTCIQFKPQCKNFKLDRKNPGYRWLNLYDNGVIETGVCRLPHYKDNIQYDASGY